ncbi:ABC transporter ATP-binding protein [Chloroflexota bacterium]
MSLIKIVDLCRRYDKRDILKNINLTIERGEVFSLIGPTGAGKTTLLRLIDFLDSPTSGTIYFNGTDVIQSGKPLFEIRRQMAFVLQKPVVFNMSVYDNIACSLKWRGVEKSKTREIISTTLDMIGISALRDRNAKTLSGGEVQRIAIGRAIATEPELLLLDEPTANLDPVSTTMIEELITSISHRCKTTVIMATHDMSQGQRLADRVGVLMNGEILQIGDWRKILDSPRNKEIAEFVGIENIINGVIVSNEDKLVTVDIGSNIIEAISDYSVGEKVYACIRPEDITVALSKLSSSARNSFAGEITRVVSLGPLSRVEISCSFSLVALITKRSAEELDLKKGKYAYANFKASGVHVIKREIS